MLWLNNQFFPSDSIAIATNDRGLLLGEGVFDTLLVRHAEPENWDLHLARLFAAATYFDIATPYDSTVLRHALNQLLKHHEKHHDTAEAVLRITVTSGAGGRGLIASNAAAPTWLMQLSPKPANKTAYTLIDSPILRNETSVSSIYKTTNYLDAITVYKKAIAAGAGDGIMYNTKRCVACCSHANIYIGKDNCIYTPPISDGVLAGITRQKLLAQSALNITEKSLNKTDIDTADFILTSNSIAGIVPISAVNGIKKDISIAHHVIDNMMNNF